MRSQTKKSLFSEEYRALLELLRAARAEAGLTQEQLAESLNVTQSFVSKCERGERRIDLVELRAWCKALGISLPELVNRLERAIKEQS